MPEFPHPDLREMAMAQLVAGLDYAIARLLPEPALAPAEELQRVLLSEIETEEAQ